MSAQLAPAGLVQPDPEAAFRRDLVAVYRQGQEEGDLQVRAVDYLLAPAAAFRQDPVAGSQRDLAVDAQLVQAAAFRLAPVAVAPQVQARTLIPGTGQTLSAKKPGIIKSTRWRWGLWVDSSPISQ